VSEKGSEKLFNGITHIRDEIIEEAENTKPGKRRHAWVKWTALAACLCLVVFGAVRIGIFGGMGGSAGGGDSGPGSEAADGVSGADGGCTYMRYAGPVFPLTALGDVSGISAERDINFNFSPYESVTETLEDSGETWSHESWKSECLVSDSYRLTNNSDADRTFTAVYPFPAQLMSESDVLPTLRLDGAELEAELRIGPYMGEYSPSSWEEYKSAVEGGYMESAFEEFPVLDEEIIVYRISDIKVPGHEAAEGSDPATLNMEFDIDPEQTKLITLGFSGGSNGEDGHRERSIWALHSGTEHCYLIVSGQDIGEYKLQGYKDGGCEPGDEIEGVTARVEKYETSLEDFIDEVITERREHRNRDYEDPIINRLSLEEYADLVKARMTDLEYAGQDFWRYGMLEDVFSDVKHIQRIMYLTAEITVPAGESVELSADMTKDASIDFTGAGKDRNGYDMVTRLGSVLDFTRQTASISGTEHIKILNQNFGFDIDNGVTSVELDLSKEHYFMDVMKRK